MAIGKVLEILPAGWIRQFRPEDNRYLYHHEDTGISSWQHPTGQTTPDISLFSEEIHAVSPDGLIRCCGARGDGYDSIWSVLIAWSLLDRPNISLNRNGILLGLDLHPNDFSEVITLLTKTCHNLLQERTLSLMTCVEPWFTPPKWEIEALLAKLERPSGQVQTIQGEAIFYLTAFLFVVEIQVLDKTSGLITSFGNLDNETIRISTDGTHYYPINPKDRPLGHFINRKWWDLHWKGHPIGLGEPTITRLI